MTDLPALVIEALDARVRVVPTNAAMADQLGAAWRRCLGTGSSSAATITLARSALPLSDAMGYRLTSEITRAAIEASAARLSLLHGAALAAPDGRVVALVAPSGTGKTTAALTLGRAGWGYVTDELVGLDGPNVIGFPKPLSLVRPEDPEAKRQVGPDEAGLARPRGPLVLARVGLLRREPDVTPAIEPVSGLAAVAGLAGQSCGLTRLPGALQRLAGLVQRCGAWSLRYAESVQLDALLRELLNLTPAPFPWTALDREATSPGPGWIRGAALDGVRSGSEAVLLVRDQLVHLGPLATSVWQALARPRTEPDLLDDLVATHGPPPDDAPGLPAVLTDLRRAGVIALRG